MPIIAIDQGTSSSRAIIFDDKMRIISSAQQEFTQYFPQPGWVEHDGEEIWHSVVTTVKQALTKAQLSIRNIAAIGIANQRETSLLWDRETGKPVEKAIVWQDRRTEDHCQRLRDEGFDVHLSAKTGLLADPYFSGTKLAWLLDKHDPERTKSRSGRLCFGTVDTFLIWRLTGGKVHATDATNASRTLLFNIYDQKWDDEILSYLDIPVALMGKVLDCADDYGLCDSEIFGAAIPIYGVAGDQQAAMLGQACFKPGMMKSTYGTGCFALLNTGQKPVLSKKRLLTTLSYRLKGEPVYALEGSIFVAGAAVQWLRDGLEMIRSTAETDRMAQLSKADELVYLVPAFVGLGAPYWDAMARGALFGLTLASGRNEIARATLEAVGYQTRDLWEAMQDDVRMSDVRLDQNAVLRVDGGMVASNFTMQFLADILNIRVERPPLLETTAFGAAWLAGSYAGIWPGRTEFANKLTIECCFVPEMTEQVRQQKYRGWKCAVKRSLSGQA